MHSIEDSGKTNFLRYGAQKFHNFEILFPNLRRASPKFVRTSSVDLRLESLQTGYLLEQTWQDENTQVEYLRLSLCNNGNIWSRIFFNSCFCLPLHNKGQSICFTQANRNRF